MAEAGEIDESSTQKRPFIPNIEEPAETPLLRKKANKGGSKIWWSMEVFYSRGRSKSRTL